MLLFCNEILFIVYCHVNPWKWCPTKTSRTQHCLQTWLLEYNTQQPQELSHTQAYWSHTSEHYHTVTVTQYIRALTTAVQSEVYALRCKQSIGSQRVGRLSCHSLFPFWYSRLCFALPSSCTLLIAWPLPVYWPCFCHMTWIILQVSSIKLFAYLLPDRTLCPHMDVAGALEWHQALMAQNHLIGEQQLQIATLSAQPAQLRTTTSAPLAASATTLFASALIAHPEKCAGEPSGCKGFLLQCTSQAKREFPSAPRLSSLSAHSLTKCSHGWQLIGPKVVSTLLRARRLERDSLVWNRGS